MTPVYLSKWCFIKNCRMKFSPLILYSAIYHGAAKKRKERKGENRAKVRSVTAAREYARKYMERTSEIAAKKASFSTRNCFTKKKTDRTSKSEAIADGNLAANSFIPKTL